MLLYLQCPTGISGDMFLAGLADLGLDLHLLQDRLQEAGLELGVQAKKEKCQGLTGSRLLLDFEPGQPWRRLQDLLDILDKINVSTGVREKCKSALESLARVEAEVHGVDLDQVHFHELGAVDTLVDILGVFWGLEQMGIKQVYCSALPWFSGEIKCSHGALPLPAPAVIKLLRGKPVYPTRFEQELITPTGALLLDQIVQEFAPGPQGVLQASGIGWGSTELEGQANGLRLILYQNQGQKDTELVWVLESNMDHLTGEELGALFEPLLQAGALDILYLPGIMKKNRCGGLLQVICLQQDLSRVRLEFFRQTLTLGIRQYQVQRTILDRTQANRKTPWGQVRTKRVNWEGEELERAEYEALQELAQKSGRSMVQLRYMLWDVDKQG